MDRCSELEYVTIPYFNYSQSIRDSLFVSSSNHVSTKNAESLTPLLGGIK